MVEVKVLEETWAEIANLASEFRGHRVRLTILRYEPHSVPGQMKVLGMFPELAGMSEADFRLAEFQGDPDDGLDWCDHSSSASGLVPVTW